MAILTAPQGGDHDRASELNAYAWIGLSLSTLFVAARVYSRLRLTRNFWYDDFSIVVTWAFSLAMSILCTVLGQLGGCRHLYYQEMDPSQAIKAFRISWIAQPPFIYALVIGKFSVAFLIMRIMGKSKWRKSFLIYGAMIGSLLFSTIAIILTFTQCRPVAALWNPNLVVMGEATCWPPQRSSAYQFFNGSWLAFIDLVLALLPITIMWNLQLSLKEKVGISAVMGLGVFACICACIKTSKLPELNARSDFTFVTVTLWIWNTIECNVVIVATCIPTLRPLFLIIFRRPGRERYLNHGIHERSSGSRDRCKRIGRISVPISDSTTAIGHIDYEETWIELDIDHQSCHRHGGIRQTLEVDVTSHKTSLEEEDMFTARRSINHLESEIRPNQVLFP